MQRASRPRNFTLENTASNMSAPAQNQQPTAEAGEQKLSPAELKKRAKVDKQARRAAQKEQQQDGGSAQESAPNGVNGEAKTLKQDTASAQAQKPKADKQPKVQQQQKQGKSSTAEQDSHHKRSGSQQQPLPIRRRPSQSGQSSVQRPISNPAQKKDSKQVGLLSHLYTQPRRHTMEGVSKDVHPAVLALGFQISSYEICGSTARCVAMLLVFKEAIQAYTTPLGTSLARHLTSHYLSPQIDFLKSCRPISESMGNAIRWLKKLIVEIDPSTPEQDAKDDLCESIDTFIRERITVTDQAIAALASPQIKNGSVVLTYAKSSIVEKTILEAYKTGTKFRVIVVDSRPLFEGKNLATSLMHVGLEVEYLPYSAISHAIKQATVVLLGAHSMLSNGRLQSRVGTAALAMQAAKADIPVIVCCESVKFSGKVALDSIVLNEVAQAEELFLPPSSGSSRPKKEGGEDEAEPKTKSLDDWKDINHLQVLNLMYDVTPTEYIRMVICEYGNIPPSSVPVVHRLANEGM
jgi:translation initiation factor eIF-2B subunit delta